jgi:hypothetical protein
MTIAVLRAEDIDVPVAVPRGLLRAVEQNLVDLTPWHITPRDLARKRLQGLRLRYRTKYVPIAHRQDNDDLAVLVPEKPDHVVVIHDFADEGSEVVGEFSSFWDWFRSAVDDLIAFE